MTISLNKNQAPSNDIMGMKPNTFCMLLHLSQLLMFCFPLAIAVPVILWAINKDKDPLVDQHGKMIVNWLITFVLGMFASLLLCIVAIGVIPFIALLIASFGFPLYGGIKANEGVFWNYSLGTFNCYYPFIK